MRSMFSSISKWFVRGWIGFLPIVLVVHMISTHEEIEWLQAQIRHNNNNAVDAHQLFEDRLTKMEEQKGSGGDVLTLFGKLHNVEKRLNARSELDAKLAELYRSIDRSYERVSTDDTSTPAQRAARRQILQSAR